MPSQFSSFHGFDHQVEPGAKKTIDGFYTIVLDLLFTDFTQFVETVSSCILETSNSKCFLQVFFTRLRLDLIEGLISK